MDSGEPDPPWLDADERATWLALIATLIKVPAALDAQLMRDSGLTLFEYTVLAMLSGLPEQKARMSELAPLTNGSLSRLSHVARRLEGRGLLRRRPDPDDGRFTEALLTLSGAQALQTAAPGHVATVRTVVFAELSRAQGRGLREACLAILHSLDPVAAAAVGRLGTADGSLDDRARSEGFEPPTF